MMPPDPTLGNKDFLKIGKVELPVLEKGGKPPRKHSFVAGLLPGTLLFSPSSACGAGRPLLRAPTPQESIFFDSFGLLPLAISVREIAIKPFAPHPCSIPPMPVQISRSIRGHDGALRGRLPIERAQEAVVLRFRVVHYAVCWRAALAYRSHCRWLEHFGSWPSHTMLHPARHLCVKLNL